MELQCDICSLQFDLDNHRPKVVPCGHSICQTCAQNPALKRKCPAACRTDPTADPGALPDNILAIRMIMEKGGAQSRKRPRLEDAKLQHLRRGVDAGRELVRQLQQLVPRAVAALNCQMNSALAHLRQLEEALEKHQREGPGAEASPTPDEVQLVVQLEDSVRLLSSSACGVVAEQGADSWRASVTLFPFHHVLRLLLLQLRADGQLRRVEVIVGPPTLTTLVITNGDVDDERNLNVANILRNESRWKGIRTLKNLNGGQTEQLLRVVAAQLEELEISDVAEPGVMGEVERITTLKRLLVRCSPDYDRFHYPDLPSQLEELAISSPSFYQLRSVQLMSRLRSLKIRRYTGEPVIFLPRQNGGLLSLLWLGLKCTVEHKDTMLSLIRANASSLQELHFATLYKEDNSGRFFPDLGPDLAACGVLALRRLVLTRSFPDDPCEQADLCLLQRQTIRVYLPSVEVVCHSCNKSYGLGF